MHDKLELGQFIVFKIAEYHLAIPIDNIQQIVEYSPQQGEKLRAMGLTQVGRHTIKLLDLHKLLGYEYLSQTAESLVFLVITHDPQGQPYGISIYSPPDLVEIPMRLMQALPPHDYPSNILRIASHAAVISQNELTTTIFLVDITRAKNLSTLEKKGSPVPTKKES